MVDEATGSSHLPLEDIVISTLEPKNDAMAIVKGYHIGREVPNYFLSPLPNRLHFDSSEPLSFATSQIIEHTSQSFRRYPVDFKPNAPLYVERDLFYFGTNFELSDLGKFHTYTWLPDKPFIPAIDVDNPYTRPQSIHAVIFEHPSYPGNYVYQVIEIGKQFKDGSRNWDPYECLFDSGVFLESKELKTLRKFH